MSKQEEIKQALAEATPEWYDNGNEIVSKQNPKVGIGGFLKEEDNHLAAKAPEYIAYLLEENERLRSALETTLFHLKKEYYMSAEDCIEEALAVGQEGEGNQDATTEA